RNLLSFATRRSSDLHFIVCKIAHSVASILRHLLLSIYSLIVKTIKYCLQRLKSYAICKEVTYFISLRNFFEPLMTTATFIHHHALSTTVCNKSMACCCCRFSHA